MNEQDSLKSYWIYIENHYGAPIKFKTATPKETAPEISVGNMNRMLVGGEKVKKLSIRTTGAGSSYFSPFTDLSHMLDQISDEALIETEDEEKNAIIVIKPSKSYQSWNIDINWENPNPIIKTISPIEETIIEIMSGCIGDDYAKKVAAISSFKYYWLAEQNGNPDLNNRLSMYISVYIAQKSQDPAQEEQYEENLKDAIDELYRMLNKYKAMYSTT